MNRTSRPSSPPAAGRRPDAREQARQRAEQAARRKRDRRILAIAVGVLVVVLVGGGIALQAWRTSRTPTAGPSGTATSFAPVTITDGKPIVLGRADAPVTIRLYEDFHCPHCADFEAEFGSAVTAAQDKGQAVVQLYPMSFIDQGSATAANAMACAAEEGFGEAYYLGLFANHTLQWNADQLISLADHVTGGKTPSSFAGCVSSGTHQSWVASINTAADAAGVSQTPTMFVDDQPVDIASLTVDKLNQMISSAPSR